MNKIINSTLEHHHSIDTLTDTSSSLYSFRSSQHINRHPSLDRLTFENVSKLDLADPSVMPLARYWNDDCHVVPHKPRRCQKRAIHMDKVIESPRLLPFPYHNDSCFLPTAEHDYPGSSSHPPSFSSSSLVSLSLQTSHNRSSLPPPTRILPSPSLSTTRGVLPRHAPRRPSRNDDMHHTSSVHVTLSALVPQSTLTTKLKRLFCPQRPLEVTVKSEEKEVKTTRWCDTIWIWWLKKRNAWGRQERTTPVEQPVWYSEFRCNPPPPPGMTTAFLS
ncbi:MAG: hypothetical protein EXX96DRAFT_545802 [Benjaminiella poitrasii]|nr:MAG: hypothetical protein EXX96DRAFT_545802 [Benjaminiella poitrasii]